jgi:hypothetical protein
MKVLNIKCHGNRSVTAALIMQPDGWTSIKNVIGTFYDYVKEPRKCPECDPLHGNGDTNTWSVADRGAAQEG